MNNQISISYLQRQGGVGASTLVWVADGRPDVRIVRVGIQVKLDRCTVGEGLQTNTGLRLAFNVQVADDVLGEVQDFIKVALAETTGRIKSQDYVGGVTCWNTANDRQ